MIENAIQNKKNTQNVHHTQIQKVLSEGLNNVFLVDEGRDDPHTT